MRLLTPAHTTKMKNVLEEVGAADILILYCQRTGPLSAVTFVGSNDRICRKYDNDQRAPSQLGILLSSMVIRMLPLVLPGRRVSERGCCRFQTFQFALNFRVIINEVRRPKRLNK